MRSTRGALVVTLLGILQNAAGRPDFGLQGEIVGSKVAIEQTGTVSSNIGALSEYKFILGSNYQPLYDERDAFYSVSEKLTTAAIAMADSVILLADDSSSRIPPLFQDAIAAIANTRTVISTGLTQEFLTFSARSKTYITDRLTDILTFIDQSLATMDGVLRKLQPAVERAQANAGGSGQPVTTSAARQVISPRLINSLLNAIDRLGYGISPLIYSVHHPLSQVDQADTYISESKGNIEDTLLQAHQEVVNFNGNLRQLRKTTNALTNTIGTAYLEQQNQAADVLPTLEASTTYESLQDALGAYDSALSDFSIEDKTFLLEQTIEDYLFDSNTYDDDLVTVYGDRICPALMAVVQVMVASGPHASYCYHKYSHEVLDLAIHNFYDIGECYQLELNRLYATSRLIGDIVSLVTYNFADLFENLNTCALNTPCPTNCDSCVTTLGKFLKTMAQLMAEQFDLILQIIPYEAKASQQRLKSCTAFSKYRLIADAHDLLADVYKCEDTGYN